MFMIFILICMISFPKVEIYHFKTTFIHKGIKYYVPTFIRDVKISFSNGSNIIQIFVFIVFLTCLFYTFFLDAKALYNSLITKNDYILNREVLKINMEFVVFLCLTSCFAPSI